LIGSYLGRPVVCSVLLSDESSGIKIGDGVVIDEEDNDGDGVRLLVLAPF
jgi:hypothetical protein